MLKNINNMTSSQEEDPQPVHCMRWSEVGFSVMADDDDAIWAASIPIYSLILRTDLTIYYILRWIL